jgi:hypothetical protein
MISIDNSMSVVEQMEAVLGKPEAETADTDKPVGEEVEAPKEDPKEEPEADDEAGEEEDAEPVVKKKGGFQRKLERKDQEIAQLRAMLEAKSTGATGAEREPQPTIEGEPTLDQFDGDLQKFAKAQVKWEIAQEKAQEQAKQVAQTWETRTAQAAKEIPDFDEYAEVTIPLTSQMREFIVESEIGPKLGYTLAKDLKEAQRIFGLPPLQQVKALAKLELELTGPTTPPVKQVTKASAAPPPIKPLASGTSATIAKDPSKMSFQEYQSWRNSGGK